MYILLAFVGLVASALAKDVIVGHEGGRLIFEQNVTASPAIWQQTRNLTINASDYEIITRVAILDKREDKKGEAAIVEGGEGFKNVTIELKSPAVFRGYDFEVQVYAMEEDGAQRPINNDQQNTQGLNDKLAKDVTDGVNKGPVTPVPTTSTTQEQNSQDKVHPAVVSKDNEQTRLNRDTQQQEQKPVSPVEVEAAKDDKIDDAHKHQRGLNPFTNQDDLPEMLDDIFNKNISAQQPNVETKKPNAASNKPTLENDSGNFMIDIKEDGHAYRQSKNLSPVSTSTVKPIAGQEEKSVETPAVETHQAKEQQIKGVPLPYVKH